MLNLYQRETFSILHSKILLISRLFLELYLGIAEASQTRLGFFLNFAEIQNFTKKVENSA